MRRMRSAKIVATLGPASSTPGVIGALFEAGVDVFRLNFSHGTHEDHKARLDAIREIETRFGRPIGVMVDIQGPKLRIGDIAGGSVILAPGRPFRLDLVHGFGNAARVTLPHPEVFAALKPGMDLLIDDGKIRLSVRDCGADFAVTEVVTGGELRDHKGVNVPSAVLDLSPLTDKDRDDLDFALELGVDWVALSFVQRPSDVELARKIVDGRAGLLVKLEKPTAIDFLDEIIAAADAVMVARGDLGVEVPPEDVPGLQKRIVRACRKSGKPVVVATQMLDSMVHAPTPTRAEASDVATAVYDGADALMLSAETAAGDYPLESVKMMNRIINRVERDSLYRTILEAERYRPEATASDAITSAASQVAQTVSAAAIVTFTSTGSTSLRAARERPTVPVLGLTPRSSTAKRLTLAWGLHAAETTDLRTFGDMVVTAVEIAKKEEFAKPGDLLVVTAGVPFGTPGATNILRIVRVD